MDRLGQRGKRFYGITQSLVITAVYEIQNSP